MPHIERLALSSLPTPKTVIADASYGNEENYLYAMSEETEPRFDFLIPYAATCKRKRVDTRRTSGTPPTRCMKSAMTDLFAQMADTSDLRNTKRKKTRLAWNKT